MPVMTGNRDDTVRSTTGHTIKFEEGANKFVPEILVRECLSRGHRLAAKEAPEAAPKATIPTPKVDTKAAPARRTRQAKPAKNTPLPPV
jgi:hypothetical protein